MLDLEMYQSRYLRWVLTESSRTHIRLNSSSSITEFYARMLKKKADGKAIVAASTKLPQDRILTRERKTPTGHRSVHENSIELDFRKRNDCLNLQPDRVTRLVLHW
jgi:2-methylcitrate dehydratase PrpD